MHRAVLWDLCAVQPELSRYAVTGGMLRALSSKDENISIPTLSTLMLHLTEM